MPLEFSVVKSAANGKWGWILTSLGVDANALRPNRHGPCPGCGGRDRFRWADRDGDGEWYCGQGGGTTGGDGFGLLGHVFGWPPVEALKRVAEVLGIESGRDVTPEERAAWARARAAAERKAFERERGLALLQELDLLAARLRRRYRSDDRPVPIAPADVDARARRIWGAASETGTSAYLERKQVPGIGVRYGQDGLLLVPVRDIGGRLLGVQFIAPDGTKKFQSGTPKRGGMAFLGAALKARPVWHPGEEGRKGWVEYPEPPTVLCLGEGYATVATVCTAMGWPGVCAFDSGNLPGVAAALAWRWPGAWIVVLGDFDGHQSPDGAPGVPAALAAAEACGGVAIWQAVPDGQCWDWNDVLVREGPEILREMLDARLSEARAGMPLRERLAAARVLDLVADSYGAGTHA